MKKRPVHLNLFAIRFPLTALTSIAHRISGVLLYLLIPLLLWAFDKSMHSETLFNEMAAFMSQFLVRFIAWVMLSALIYHIVAGLRHLLMDMHIGEEKQSGKRGAFVVWVVSLVFIIWSGACILW